MPVSSIVPVAVLGSACSLPEPSRVERGQGEDTAAIGSGGAADKDLIQELACSGDLPVYELWPYDVTIDWTELTENLWGESVDPAGFETVGLMVMAKGTTASSFVESMCEDAYDPPAVNEYVDAPAKDRTSIRTYELSFLGTHFNGATPGSVLWLLWSSSREPGIDIEMLAVLGVVDDGPTTVDVTWPR
jgi:hypothetical protein